MSTIHYLSTPNMERRAATMSERRGAVRVPIGVYVDLLVGDESHRCFGTDLSPTGVYVERPFVAFAHRAREVQISLPLPGLAEPIWTRGEVVHDRVDSLFHGQAVRFVAMARAERKALEAFLYEQRRALYRPYVRLSQGARVPLPASPGAT